MKKITRCLFVFACVSVLIAPVIAAAAAKGGRYLIQGACGRVGDNVVHEFLVRGVPARNLILTCYKPALLAAYAELGADVREADVTRPETLVPAYTGGTTMVLISLGPTMQPRGELQKRMVDAAAKAGVKRVVYTSWIGAEGNRSRMSLDHLETEEALKASGMQWTILRNGEYGDNFILAAAQKAAATGRIVQPPDERFSAPITFADHAAAIVGAMRKPASAGKTYDIMGPERVTQTDIARVTSEITGRKIEVVAGQPGMGREVLVPPPVGGAPPPPLTGGVEPSLPVLTPAQLATDAAGFKELTGRRAQGLRDFLKAHRAELLQ